MLMTAQNIKMYTVRADQSIREALRIIDDNHCGTIIVLENGKKVAGVVTDGDVRRGLMAGKYLNDPIETCLNRSFVSVNKEASRERVLKLLDDRIKLLPVLDTDGKLIAVYSRRYLPPGIEYRIFARARSPVRISFGGGGTDLTRHFVSNGGIVINATIALYSYATLRKRNDGQILVYSHDLREKVQANDLNEFLQKKSGAELIRSIVQAVQPSYGFELYIGSEFPIGSGLGGSSAVTAAVLGCFNEFRQDRWDNYELAEIAFQAERLHLDIAGGWQDQYASVFGGFNYMEFTEQQNVVHPLRIHPDIIRELESSLILCDTFISHNSGEIHTEQNKALSDEDARKMIARNKELTHEIKNHLLRGRLGDFGKALHNGWMLKRSLSPVISSDRIDEIYNIAISNGAVGGKLLGAGGGGHFLFYVSPFRNFELIEALEGIGLSPRQFTFDEVGLQTWSVRDPEMDINAQHTFLHEEL